MAMFLRSLALFLYQAPEYIEEAYDLLRETIKRYHDDIEFYREKSSNAKRRAEVLLDNEKEFIRILDEVDKREGIQ